MLRDYASLPFGDAASLDDVTSGQMADLYDREVLGTEEIQGRTAWIVDITLKSTHPSSGPKASAITIAHKRIWVDQEAFFVLKMLIWDRKNDLISTNEYESFEINTRISPEVFNYSPPQDALVADLHSTQNEANRVQLWQHVAQRANFPVQMGPSRLPDLDAGNPNIDMRTGVVTSAYYSQKTGGSPFLGLVVAQGPVSALPVKGEGYNVAQEGIQARFYPAAEGRDYTSLVVDRGGIRTVVRNYQHEGRSGAEWTLYRNLTAVPSR
jgi:hypothetical protein